MNKDKIKKKYEIEWTKYIDKKIKKQSDKIGVLQKLVVHHPQSKFILKNLSQNQLTKKDLFEIKEESSQDLNSSSASVIPK